MHASRTAADVGSELSHAKAPMVLRLYLEHATYIEYMHVWRLQAKWQVLSRLLTHLVLEGTTDQLRHGMQEGTLAKAGGGAALGPLGEHGGLPGGYPIHASPGLAYTPGLLADDAHAAIPVSLHGHDTIHTLAGM